MRTVLTVLFVLCIARTAPAQSVGVENPIQIDVEISNKEVVSIQTSDDISCVEDLENKKDWILTDSHTLVIGGRKARSKGTITLFMQNGYKTDLMLKNVGNHRVNSYKIYIDYKNIGNTSNDPIHCQPLIS